MDHNFFIIGFGALSKSKWIDLKDEKSDLPEIFLLERSGMRLILETAFSIELAFGTIFVKMKKVQNPQILASYYTAENSKLISALIFQDS